MEKKAVLALALALLICAVALSLPIPEAVREKTVIFEFRYYDENGAPIKTEYSGSLDSFVLVTRVIGGRRLQGRLYLSGISRKSSGTLKGSPEEDGWSTLEVFCSEAIYAGYLG